MTHRFFALALSLACMTHAARAQTVGLITHGPGSYDSGYVLFAPMSYTTTYLIDKCGKVVHSWNSQYIPGESAYLRPDGTLVRAGVLNGAGAKQGTSCTEIFDWNGALKWRFTFDSIAGQHHDFEVMPNGNVLLISHEIIPTPATVAAGRDPSLISGQFVSDRLVEIQPIGTDSGRVVWQWRPFDHLVQDFDPGSANFGVVAQHPELVNVNFPKTPVGEWLHFNSVRYNARLDQIVVSAHHTSEIWIIDHSTTTQQAASHTGGKRGKGGDLLYRWGNPAAYGQGRAVDEVFYGQHQCMWIPDGRPQGGKIMVFNNGTGRPTGMYASVDVFTPPVDSAGNYDTHTLPYLPAAVDWSFTDTPPANIVTQTAGGAEMLPNGSVLICTGQMGSLFEIDSTRTRVLWKYVAPVNSAGPLTQGVPPSGNPVFKSVFYPFTYPAFEGRTLVAGAPIELNALNYDCKLNDGSVGVIESQPPVVDVFTFPNPASDRLTVAGNDRIDGLALYDALGRSVVRAGHAGTLDTSPIPSGVYQLVIRTGGTLQSKPIVIVKQ